MEIDNVDFASEKTAIGKDFLVDLREMVNAHVYSMKKFMEEDNSDLPPFFHILTNDHKVIMVPFALFGNMSKVVLMSAICQMAKKYTAVALVQVTEGWTLRAESKTREKIDAIYETYGGIKNHPDAVECFMIIASYNHRGITKGITYTATITRHADGTRTLDEGTAKIMEDVVMAQDCNFSVPPNYLVPIEI